MEYQPKREIKITINKFKKKKKNNNRRMNWENRNIILNKGSVWKVIEKRNGTQQLKLLLRKRRRNKLKIFLFIFFAYSKTSSWIESMLIISAGRLIRRMRKNDSFEHRRVFHCIWSTLITAKILPSPRGDPLWSVYCIYMLRINRRMFAMDKNRKYERTSKQMNKRANSRYKTIRCDMLL